MKKAIAIVALAATFAIAFVSCGGKKGTCDECGEENVTVYTVKDEVSGTGLTANLCKDCKAEYDAAVKALKAVGL